MTPLVFDKITLTREGFPALAGERLLLGVTPLMSFQVGSSGACVVTDITYKRFLFRSDMALLMGRQVKLA